MEEWKEYKLKEICNLSAGGDAPQNVVKSPSGKMTTPIYSNGERESGLYGFTDSYKIEAPAVTISARGSIGYVCYRKENFVPIVRLITAKANEQIVSNEYLYYCLRNTHIWGDGSVQKQLTVPMISEYLIKVPPLTVQDKIISILKSLDDKIEVNRRINENLEQQAQALFKSWFVDFEPFKDGEFVESELGMIPKGWKVGTLKDITIQRNERVGDQDNIKVMSPINTGELMLSEEFFTKQVFSKSIAKYIIVEKGDFAYNPARVNIGSLGRNEFGFKGCVSPVYVVFSCVPGYEYFFDLYRKTDKFKTEVKLRAIGGVRQTLSYDEFCLLESIIPPRDVVERFNIVIMSIKALQKHYNLESRRLASLRDTLLPRLMSGEIRVDEINSL